MIQDRFNNDFNHLLGETIPSAIAVAVSGGVDSVALLHFVSNWARPLNINISVFSVNHNLRPEAALDILHVQNLATKLGHKFFELNWYSGGNKSSLQERAREGRYDLMTDKCHELGINTLLTAHHFDDMLETYLMRQSKKSGIFGLSSSASYFRNNIRVLRPLFNFAKNELVGYLQTQNISWCEDSSNQSNLYARNCTRKKIASMSNEYKLELAKEIKVVNKRAAELNGQLIVAMADSLQLNNYGFAKIDWLKLKNYCADIRIQILNYVLTIIGGKTSTPRFRSTEKLLQKIDELVSMKCSLHGCVLKKKNDRLWVFREQASISSDVDVFDGVQYWDNRFVIGCTAQGHHPEQPSYCEESTDDEAIQESLDCHALTALAMTRFVQKLTISHLTFEEYLSIKDKINLKELAKISDNNHKLLLFTLPVIKNIEKVVAIPHISYYDGFGQEKDVEVVFRPNFISRFTHFL
jgi:tRNA(Ile)-lysidine synthase